MNEANTADESTDSMNVLVTAAGLVGVDRYVKDYSEIAKRVDNSLTGLEAMLGKSIDTVYTRGSPELQNELEMVLEQGVESSFFYWTEFLNDEAVIEDGTEVVPAVREEGQPKIDTSSKGAIPFGEIDEARERRAKAKAAAKNNHYLFSEYFEDYPMVEALVNVNCGSHRGLAQIRDARGNNVWVNGRAGHVRQTIDLNVKDQILYSRFMIDGDMDVDDLHESQLEELRTELSPEEAADYGIPTPSTATPTAGVTPASAD